VIRRHLLVLFAWLVAACAPAADPALRSEPADHRLYVTSNDWHTQIVVAAASIPDGLLPEAAALPEADWLAVSWGDRDYYPTEDPPFAMALEAALLPGPSVVHLIPMPRPPRSSAGFEVLEIAVTGAGLAAMLTTVDAAVDRSAAAPAPVVAPGLYPGSQFFPAEERFHLFNTCNTWTARRLVAAGLPIRARGVVIAEDLMGQLRDLPMARPALG
jgi:uncharacterized protein (TIGR02117 family)